VPLDHPSLSQWIERNPFCTSYVSYMVYILLIDGSYILEASRRSSDCRRRHLFFRQLQQKNLQFMIDRGFLEQWLDSHRLRVNIGVDDAGEVTTIAIYKEIDLIL
jgi:hypothetical protein